MLIKQGKDKGLNLSAAIDAARRFKARHDAELAVEPQEVEPRSLAAASSGATVLT